MKIFVVIPGFNEKKYLPKVLGELSMRSQNVVFVDDGSSDGSAKVAERFTPNVLSHETNLGKGAAMLTGAEYAFGTLGADAIVFMDADDQHDSSHLPEFEAKLKTHDVVLGVRNMGANMPLFRFLGNKFVSVTLNMLYGAYIADIPSGYKAMTRSAFDKLKWKSSGYEVETEIAVRLAESKIPYEMVEIRSIYHDTDKGMTLIDAFNIGLCLLQWRLGL